MEKKRIKYKDVHNEYTSKYIRKLGIEETDERANLLIEAIQKLEDDLNNGKVVIPDDAWFDEIVVNKEKNTITFKLEDQTISVDINDFMLYVRNC